MIKEMYKQPWCQKFTIIENPSLDQIQHAMNDVKENIISDLVLVDEQDGHLMFNGSRQGRVMITFSDGMYQSAIFLDINQPNTGEIECLHGVNCSVDVRMLRDTLDFDTAVQITLFYIHNGKFPHSSTWNGTLLPELRE